MIKVCFSQNGPEVGGQFQGRRGKGAESGQERCSQRRFLRRGGEEVGARRLRRGRSPWRGRPWAALVSDAKGDEGREK